MAVSFSEGRNMWDDIRSWFFGFLGHQTANWVSKIDWRHYVAKLAASNDRRQHKALGNILIGAVTKGVQEKAAWVVGFAAQILAVVALVLYFAQVIGITAKWSSAETRAEIADAIVTANQHTGMFIFESVFLSIALFTFVPTMVYVIFWGVRRMRAAYGLSLWFDKFHRGVLALADKEQAARLTVLELNVRNEDTLRAYLKALLLFAELHKIPVWSDIVRWLEWQEPSTNEAATAAE